MKRIQTKIKRFLLKRNIKVRKKRTIKFIESYKASKDFLPCEDHEIWDQLGKIFEDQVVGSWRLTGRMIDLRNPRTLAEKLEWIKLNDHGETQVRVADKLAVRKYVLDKTNNSRLLNHLYGIYTDAELIQTDELPAKFVVKANNWSGGNYICTDPTKFDETIKLKLNGYLQQVYLDNAVEWPYWKIEPRLLVEEYLEDQFSQLVDYKVFCFNGVPRMILVYMDRHASSAANKLYFDTDWNLLPFSDPNFPAIKIGKNFPRPKSLPEMLNAAKLLSQEFTFLRVDFYDIYGECRFGECTLHPQGGRSCVFRPDKWNFRVGEWLELPEPNKNPCFAYYKTRLCNR